MNLELLSYPYNRIYGFGDCCSIAICSHFTIGGVKEELVSRLYRYRADGLNRASRPNLFK